MPSTVTVSQVGSDPDGKGYWKVTITETSVDTTTEVSVLGVPNVGRIVRQASAKTAGSGSTLDPIVGMSTDPSGVEIAFENGTAAATVNNEPNSGFGASYAVSNNTLYHRSRPDSGSDNSVTTIYFIRGGW